MTDPPLDAFGLSGEPIALPGGVSGVLRFGDVVIKSVTDVPEAEWEQATFATLPPRADVRWARPIPARDGQWVVDSWIADEFIPDLTPVAPDWAAVIEFGARFHAATADIAAPHAMLLARTHRWARGERHAFDEVSLALPPDVAEVDALLTELCATDPGPQQVVDVDLTNNVFLDSDDLPVILDIAPGWRSHAYAAAVVIADALVWSDATIDCVDTIGGVRPARSHLARALRFRLATDELARQHTRQLGAPAPPTTGSDIDLTPYRRALRALS